MSEHQDGLNNLTENTDNDKSHQMSDEFLDLLEEEVDLAGGEFQEDEAFIGAVGRTMYDTPTSQ